MCLYPRLIDNPKYKPNKKNGGNVPLPSDNRVRKVPVGCQKCMECRKQKAREWQVRLCEEIRTKKNGVFVTLTFSNESIKELNEALIEERGGEEVTGYERDNEIARIGIRRFLERWRKKHGKSVRHWLVTELGHTGTENVHVHGIIWTDHVKDIRGIWNYGYVWDGNREYERKVNYVSERTINYIVKYIHKIDFDHKHYNSKIFCSAGIGSGYMERPDSKINKYLKGKTIEVYRTRKGTRLNLPIYYRNKIYTEEQRELLWLEKLDKGERWVCGEKCEKINTIEGSQAMNRLLKWYQKRNKQLGYDSPEIKWDEKEYENNRRDMLFSKRIEAVWTE